ncbi:Neisseria PilC protein [Neisseria gonorrhoeae]|uniref:PilC family type IV pilus tip adhesin n=1 Tax=Neisseria gonorrhoeae TaxID=485 RepID=UPI000671C40A|nr:PilC family type IV pilus tip adhesin [Neisseria gonorrhoeae]AKP13706.1 Neisseria PilC protein [Neisseria gonorrhoeae]
MNKTLKRRVFRHTALYAAILMFSHTGGGGGAQAQTREYAIIMNERNQPEVKWEGSYSTLREKDRKREYTHHKYPRGGSSVSFNNNDELVSQQSGTAVFGTATYLPPYGKVSGFDTDSLKGRANAVDWIRTTRIALAGYSYAGVVCNSTTGCPKLVYKTRFSFDNPDLAKTGGRLNRHTEPSRDNSPIYKLKDYPWLGVSFNLGAEGTAKDGKVTNKLVSSFDENNSNQNLVYTTEGHNISLGNWQRESTAMAYYLNAKLHLLDKKGIKDITSKTVRLGVLKPSIDVRKGNTGLSGILSFWATWDIKDTGQIPVKLGLPQVKAGRCINKPNPNNNTKAPSPALTAPALWFGPGQDGKVQMYSASVSTYPGSSSSRIFLQELKTKTDPGRPGRHSLAALNTQDIKSREPNFNSRQTVIRLPGGVYKINSGKNGGRVAGINGNDGKNDTFGIFKDRLVTPVADEWSEVLLPWTARYYGNDDIFKTFNQPNNKKQSDKKQYSQKYRIRTKEDDNDKPRDLGDIVNSPIVAVDGYLATSANDGMVHIFKKNGGSDERSYNLKLSYIPGTMPRQYFDNDTSALKDSTLAQELRTFAEKGYVGDRYGVDGGFVLRRITDDQDRQKHFFMFGAMGLGGRGAYALDLTKIDSNPVGVSMFDVQNDKNNNNRVKLGYTVGTPQIGKTQNGKYAAFLASGYAAKQIASQENKTALYVYDLGNGSGSLIKKIEVQGGKGGLSSPTLVDKDLDGIVDIAYAGDRGGNMYRFDLSDNDPNKWSVRTIFEGGKPITSAPAVSRLADKRVVIFGTGSDLSEEDVVDTKEQYIYGIFDDDKGTGTVKVTVQNGTGGGLLKQTLTKESKTLFLSNNKASGGSADKGWVVKLREGERVTVKPTVVLRTAFVTIRSYTGNDKCGAQTAILGINTADGGALTPRSARPIVPDHNSVAQYSGHKKTSKGKSIPIGCMEKGGKTVCPNGYVYDKPVNVRYLDEKKTDDFPVTADGDAGGSGTFKEGKKPARNNRCFSGKGVRTLLMNDLDSLDITGPMCGIKRLSWREVFF